MNGPDGFRAEIVALLPKMRAFALALARTAHDADDLVQSAVERALKHGPNADPGFRLDSWMYKIMQNLWIDQTRRRKVRAESATLDDLDVVGEDGRRVVEGRSAANRVQQAFNLLSPELRAAASLVIVNGMSYREAADALSVPIGTIMSRVARSRAALRDSLSGEAPKEAAR
jgi:RNA polymerase sigma-70 factor, ECF subfamily